MLVFHIKVAGALNSIPACSPDSFLFINLINVSIYSLFLLEIYFFISVNYSVGGDYRFGGL